MAEAEGEILGSPEHIPYHFPEHDGDEDVLDKLDLYDLDNRDYHLQDAYCDEEDLEIMHSLDKFEEESEESDRRPSTNAWTLKKSNGGSSSVSAGAYAHTGHTLLHPRVHVSFCASVGVQCVSSDYAQGDTGERCRACVAWRCVIGHSNLQCTKTT